MLCDFFFTGDWWQRLSWGISWYMVLWRHLVCADGGLLTFWWTKSHDFVQKGIWPYLHLSFYLGVSYVTCGLTCAMCFNLPSDGLFSFVLSADTSSRFHLSCLGLTKCSEVDFEDTRSKPKNCKPLHLLSNFGFLVGISLCIQLWQVFFCISVMAVWCIRWLPAPKIAVV